jgi:hypothetical protein
LHIIEQSHLRVAFFIRPNKHQQKRYSTPFHKQVIYPISKHFTDKSYGKTAILLHLKSLTTNMKKLLALACLVTLTSFHLPTTYVYLCDSEGGKKYHFTESCRGLSNCKHRIVKVTLEEAKGLGKGLCGWED